MIRLDNKSLAALPKLGRAIFHQIIEKIFSWCPINQDMIAKEVFIWNTIYYAIVGFYLLSKVYLKKKHLLMLFLELNIALLESRDFLERHSVNISAISSVNWHGYDGFLVGMVLHYAKITISTFHIQYLTLCSGKKSLLHFLTITGRYCRSLRSNKKNLVK